MSCRPDFPAHRNHHSRTDEMDDAAPVLDGTRERASIDTLDRQAI